MHHDNILLNSDGNYVTIDPKGVIGPPIFDLPRFIMNELDTQLNKSGKEHIELIIKELSKSLNYSILDISKLFFMEVILGNVWCQEDGEEINLQDIYIAEKIFDKHKKKEYNT